MLFIHKPIKNQARLIDVAAPSRNIGGKRFPPFGQAKPDQFTPLRSLYTLSACQSRV